MRKDSSRDAGDAKGANEVGNAGGAGDDPVDRTGAYKIDFAADGTAVRWHLTDDGARPERDEAWTPSFYVAGPDPVLAAVEDRLVADRRVVATGYEERFRSLDADGRESVLRIDATDPREVRSLARRIREVHERGADRPPGTLRFYNVDLSPEFRYCLETGTDPTPTRELRAVHLSLPESDRVDGDVSELSVETAFEVAAESGAVSRFSPSTSAVDSESSKRSESRDSSDGLDSSGGFDGFDEFDGFEKLADSTGSDDDPDRTESGVLSALDALLRAADPDVLVVDSAELVPLLFERAEALGVEFRLGRREGYDRLAGANTFESYGRVGHSPARYDVPGRVVIDTSNSFLWAKSSLAGLLDLVERSWRPLQETGWASIGTVLTAIEVREAFREWGVLVPWEKWDPESFSDVRTLHAADRGGHTTEPRVGYHRRAYELDFASLYPTIICEHNISPETVECDCHAGREDVPNLGYSVCDDPGFLPSVLRPIVDDRAALKEEARDAEERGDEQAAADARARVGALKWVLVACFGYQGYRNAKFGRIACHEAINAVAREVFLDAKDELEEAGWRVVHGIVDSLWVTPRDDAGGAAVGDVPEPGSKSDPKPEPDSESESNPDSGSNPDPESNPKPQPEPIEQVAARISERVGIPLELEAEYDWVCFCPTRDGRRGALTRYFGRKAAVDGESDSGYKVRGIEARQRSTPAFIADAQRDLLDAVDRHADPAAVVERLRRHLGDLESGGVDPAALAIRTRLSKAPADYTRNTLPAAAAARATHLGLERSAGQDVRYVVVADGARGRGRVRLACEDPETYDAAVYRAHLLRAAESVVSPFGWDRDRIERELRSDGGQSSLVAFDG